MVRVQFGAAFAECCEIDLYYSFLLAVISYYSNIDVVSFSNLDVFIFVLPPSACSFFYSSYYNMTTESLAIEIVIHLGKR